MFSVINKYFVISGAAILAISCGQENAQVASSDVKIVGGVEVPENQNDPRRFSTVALVTDKHIEIGKSFCSGSIIGRKAILTAAHCIYNKDRERQPAKNIKVAFGTKVSQAQVRQVKIAEHHPGFDMKVPAFLIKDDVAVLILDNEIPEGFAPVSVGDLGTQVRNGTKIRLAGYGVKSSRKKNTTGVLRQVNTKVSTLNKLNRRFSSGGFRKGACAGDSGGPAFVVKNGQYSVVGALSTGAEIVGWCLGSNQYTDVRYYGEFVAKMLSLQ